MVLTSLLNSFFPYKGKDGHHQPMLAFCQFSDLSAKREHLLSQSSHQSPWLTITGPHAHDMLNPDPRSQENDMQVSQAWDTFRVSTVGEWGSLLIQTKTHSSDGMIPQGGGRGKWMLFPGDKMVSGQTKQHRVPSPNSHETFQLCSISACANLGRRGSCGERCWKIPSGSRRPNRQP